MKKLTIYFLFALFFSFTLNPAYAQVSGWQWSHPKPQGNHLHSIKAFNGSTWFIAGGHGTFMKTTNAGQTWSIQYETEFSSISTRGKFWFMDMNTGVSIGGSYFIRTTNGGVTWDSITYTNSSTWHSVYFINSNYGYASGSGLNVFAKTSNGGVTWSVFPPAFPDIPVGTYSEIYALDTSTIFIAGSNNDSCVLRKSDNGGITWKKLLKRILPGQSME